METLYRKVAVSDRKPLKSGSYYTNIDKSFYRKSTGEFKDNNDSYIVYPTFWLEEIPDPTAQLKADKNEMIEKLEEIYGYLGSYFDGEKVSIGELIQKHKK